jgi:hypothetical protein
VRILLFIALSLLRMAEPTGNDAAVAPVKSGPVPGESLDFP